MIEILTGIGSWTAGARKSFLFGVLISGNGRNEFGGSLVQRPTVRWHLKAILAGVVFCSSTPGAEFRSGKFPITSRGQPKAEIVVEVQQPEPALAFAAQELQRYVREMSGATLPIAQASSPKPAIVLVRGTPFTPSVSGSHGWGEKGKADPGQASEDPREQDH